MLGRTVMAESGMGGRFWFSATMNGVNCRNVTYKKHLGITPHENLKRCMDQRRMSQSLDLLVAEYACTSTRKGVRRESTHQGVLKRSILDLQQISIKAGTKSYITSY